MRGTRMAIYFQTASAEKVAISGAGKANSETKCPLLYIVGHADGEKYFQPGTQGRIVDLRGKSGDFAADSAPYVHWSGSTSGGAARGIPHGYGIATVEPYLSGTTKKVYIEDPYGILDAYNFTVENWHMLLPQSECQVIVPTSYGLSDAFRESVSTDRHGAKPVSLYVDTSSSSTAKNVWGTVLNETVYKSEVLTCVHTATLSSNGFNKGFVPVYSVRDAAFVGKIDIAAKRTLNGGHTVVLAGETSTNFYGQQIVVPPFIYMEGGVTSSNDYTYVSTLMTFKAN